MATNRSVFLCGCIHLVRPSNCFDILYKSRISGEVTFLRNIYSYNRYIRVDRDVSQDAIELPKENFNGEEPENEDGLEDHKNSEIPSNVDLQCEVTAKDANSAISRAKSPFCKNEIRRLYCLNKGNRKFRKIIRSDFLFSPKIRKSEIMPKIIIRHNRINKNHKF